MNKTKTAFLKAARMLADIAETLLSAALVVVLYIVYLPFGIARAMFDRQAIRTFYADVAYVTDQMSQRIARRKEAGR